MLIFSGRKHVFIYPVSWGDTHSDWVIIRPRGGLLDSNSASGNNPLPSSYFKEPRSGSELEVSIEWALSTKEKAEKEKALELQPG